VRAIDLEDLEIEFVKVQSYQGLQTSGNLNSLIGLKSSLIDRDVVILEDIVDTGLTIDNLIHKFLEDGARSIKIATLIKNRVLKSQSLIVDFFAFEIDNSFIVGMGLDFDGWGRNFKDIWKKI